MELPKRDGDGYLVDMNSWTEEIGRAMEQEANNKKSIEIHYEMK